MMELTIYQKALIVTGLSTKSEEAVTPQQWHLRQKLLFRNHTLVQFCFMHLTHGIRKNQTWVNSIVSNKTDRPKETNTPPVQMFLKHKDILFFNKFVKDCFILNFDNFVSRNQAIDRNLWEDVSFPYSKDLVLSERKFFCRTFKYANILVKKYSSKIQMDPILFRKQIKAIFWVCFSVNVTTSSFFSC